MKEVYVVHCSRQGIPHQRPIQSSSLLNSGDLNTDLAAATLCEFHVIIVYILDSESCCMMPAPRNLTQDPMLSPTEGHAATQTESTASHSIRRNLFSAHLSRRPVSKTASSLFRPNSSAEQNAQSHHDIFSSGPTLHPSRRAMDVKDIFDPDASPPRYHTGSPSTGGNLFPRESIVALNPLTGRPLLPNLPTLPPRLRLSEDDDDEQGSDEEIEHPEYHDYHEYSRSYSQSPAYNRNFMPSSDFDFDPDIDLNTSDLNFLGIPRRQNVANTFMDAGDDDESRRDRERIERLLAEMMSRQRARARTLNSSETSTHLPALTLTSTGGTSATRTTRASRSRDRKMDDPQRFDLKRSNTESALGGAGAAMDPIEKDELMGLIVTSLRRKLQQAEDEGWIYGGAEGLGGIGMGGDLSGDGVYE